MSSSLVPEGLSHYGFFASLTDEGRRCLAGVARPFRAGPSLFRQEGDACDAVTLLSAGEVQVIKRRATGREIVLYRVGPGDVCVLETLAVLTGARYRAEAAIDREATGVSIDGEAFRGLVDAEPALRAFLFASFEARLAMALSLVSEVALATLESRLAGTLARQAGPSPEVHTTHEQLARELACGREAVSRLLEAWARAGIVELGRAWLRVLDPARLGELAREGAQTAERR